MLEMCISVVAPFEEVAANGDLERRHMTPRVLILLCGSANTSAAVQQVPRLALSDFYNAWNVDLSFETGPLLERDPTNDPAALEALLRKYRPAAGKSGHAILFMADFSIEGNHVNGMLLDSGSRGACAVFTGSTVYAANKGDDRFEVIAHEIGHMLNLVHSEADESFPTAMNQWDRRSTASQLPARLQAWQDLIQASGAAQRPKITGYFAQGTRSPLGLPMSTQCQHWIGTAQAGGLAPWGDPFRGLGGDDRLLLNGSQCTLSLHVLDDQVHVGEPVDCTVALHATGATPESRVIPQGLGLRDGTIALSLRNPGGEVHKYAAKIMLCSSGGQRLLAPGQSIRRSFSLLADRFGLLFPEEGGYELWAEVPALGLSSAPVAIEVRAPVSAFVSRKFRDFLAEGMPTQHREGWRAVTRAVNDRTLSRRVRAHLASERVSRRVLGNSSANAALIAAAGSETPRSMQKNLLVRLARSRHSAAADTAGVRMLLDAAEAALRQDDDEHPSLDYVALVRQELERRNP
jgi:hypothetical protein